MFDIIDDDNVVGLILLNQLKQTTQTVTVSCAALTHLRAGLNGETIKTAYSLQPFQINL